MCRVIAKPEVEAAIAREIEAGPIVIEYGDGEDVPVGRSASVDHLRGTDEGGVVSQQVVLRAREIWEFCCLYPHAMMWERPYGRTDGPARQLSLSGKDPWFGARNKINPGLDRVGQEVWVFEFHPNGLVDTSHGLLPLWDSPNRDRAREEAVLYRLASKRIDAAPRPAPPAPIPLKGVPQRLAWVPDPDRTSVAIATASHTGGEI